MWLYSCTQEKVTETATTITEPKPCSAGSYDGYLKVWTIGEESYNIDTDTLCESDFSVDISADNTIHAEGICEFIRGNNPRILTYDLIGEHQEQGQYSGTVRFTRGNGAVEDSTFSGHCTENVEVDLFLEWYVSFTTNGGERTHHVILQTEE